MSFHQPLVAASATPGVWDVYCDACTAETGQRIHPCRYAGFASKFPPAQLVVQLECEARCDKCTEVSR